MTQSLTDLLLAISDALLVPVVILLLVLCAGTVAYAGGLVAEALERRRQVATVRRAVRALEGDAAARGSLTELAPLPRLVARALSGPFAAREKTLDDLELVAERLLAHLHTGVRLGPMLGLAGTLIPLGPALVALSTGDLETLSNRLVVAFGTTVVGLFVGGACFLMHTIRRAWYRQDLSDAEFLLERMT